MHINHDTKVSKNNPYVRTNSCILIIIQNFQKKYQCIQGSTTGIDEPKGEENEEQERESKNLRTGLNKTCG
jgi:hypothetical protein